MQNFISIHMKLKSLFILSRRKSITELFHDCMKHIEMKIYSICEYVEVQNM